MVAIPCPVGIRFTFLGLLGRAATGLVAAALAVSAVAAGESRTLYRHKAWEVRAVAFDNGRLSCVATVTKPSGDAFSVWSDGITPVNLHFFSPRWNFRPGNTDIVIRIDRRKPWTLNDANLQGEGIFFYLGPGNSSLRLMQEIMAGNRLRLFDNQGGLVRSYSLAGSKASIRKLIECTNALKKLRR